MSSEPDPQTPGPPGAARQASGPHEPAAHQPSEPPGTGARADRSSTEAQAEPQSFAWSERPDVAADPLPTEAEIERTAVPATVRRAPRFGAFVSVGALVGLVVGLVLAVGLQPDQPVVTDQGFVPFLGGHGAVRTVCAAAGAVFGGFLGGGIATIADRRSRAR